MKKQDGIELIERVISNRNLWNAYKKVKENDGAPLSPILANVYLNKLDRELEKRGQRFVRYADDFVIYVKTPRAGERVMERKARFATQQQLHSLDLTFKISWESRLPTK